MTFLAFQQKVSAIRANRLFEYTAVLIIIVSALLIGVGTYAPEGGWSTFIYYADIGITVFFIVEIVIRFLAEENKKQFFKDPWNLFDSGIVLLSIVPIPDNEMAKVARLIRVFRILRMISLIPELKVLLRSLFRALPPLGYVAMLMFIIFYIYAAFGAIFFAEIEPQLWGNISVSLLTLFRVMTFEDWTDVMYQTMAEPGFGWTWAYYITFIFFTAFAFLNMVIGIVVNVFEEESQKQKVDDKNKKHRLLAKDDQQSQVSNEQLAQKIDELSLLVVRQQDLLQQLQSDPNYQARTR